MRRKDREISDPSDIEQIISNSDVCRIAFADSNIPYIVTMNFGYLSAEHSCFYFHCAREGRKMELMKKNNYVCFELDCDHELYPGEKACDWGMKFSSVVGYGRLYLVTEREERIKGLNSIMEHYSGRGEFEYGENIFASTAVLRLDVEEMNGKRKL